MEVRGQLQALKQFTPLERALIFYFYLFIVHSVDYLITHTNICIYIYIYII